MVDPEDNEPFCYTCISSAYWQECESCDDGDIWVEGYEGDEIPVPCDWCKGEGGWWLCLGPEHHDLDEGSIHAIPVDQRG